MEIEYDPEKSARNERERGLPFAQVADLDWNRAFTFADARRDYCEERVTAWVPMQGRLYAVCFTQRGRAIRIISFRKANNREEKAYEQATIDR